MGLHCLNILKMQLIRGGLKSLAVLACHSTSPKPPSQTLWTDEEPQTYNDIPEVSEPTIRIPLDILFDINCIQMKTNQPTASLFFWKFYFLFFWNSDSYLQEQFPIGFVTKNRRAWTEGLGYDKSRMGLQVDGWGGATWVGASNRAGLADLDERWTKSCRVLMTNNMDLPLCAVRLAWHDIRMQHSFWLMTPWPCISLHCFVAGNGHRSHYLGPRLTNICWMIFERPAGR